MRTCLIVFFPIRLGIPTPSLFQDVLQFDATCLNKLSPVKLQKIFALSWAQLVLVKQFFQQACTQRFVQLIELRLGRVHKSWGWVLGAFLNVVPGLNDAIEVQAKRTKLMLASRAAYVTRALGRYIGCAAARRFQGNDTMPDLLLQLE